MLISIWEREVLLRARLDNLLQEKERLKNPELSKLAEPLRKARLTNKNEEIRLVLEEFSELSASVVS